MLLFLDLSINEYIFYFFNIYITNNNLTHIIIKVYIWQFYYEFLTFYNGWIRFNFFFIFFSFLEGLLF